MYVCTCVGVAIAVLLASKYAKGHGCSRDPLSVVRRNKVSKLSALTRMSTVVGFPRLATGQSGGSGCVYV